MKLRDPSHEVTVLERNKADDTFGWGVVLSDDALGNMEANDPISTAAIRRLRVLGRHRRRPPRCAPSRAAGFAGIEMKMLLLLQERARELGVDLQFQSPASAEEHRHDYDVVVA